MIYVKNGCKCKGKGKIVPVPNSGPRHENVTSCLIKHNAIKT